MFTFRKGIVAKHIVASSLLIVMLVLLVVPTMAQTPSPLNLVVVVSDTRTLSAPSGTETNLTLRACQTFFLRQLSSDGLYARLFITPSVDVWVPANVVQDVGENYGQRNGPPATCTGVPLAVPSAVATTVNPAPTQPAPTTVVPPANVVSGSATPAANTRITPNLVLVSTNVTLLNAPGGAGNGLNVRTCQTFFAVELSADRQFYRLQVTPTVSGWISIANIQDVAENYGQRNGEARVPGC